MTAPNVIATWTKNPRERIRLALDCHRGHHRVDLRTLTLISQTSGVWSPTAKGVSLEVGQLPALARAFADAEVQARALGLIGGEA